MSSSLMRSKPSSEEVLRLDHKYHFRWPSIRNLLYITFAYSSHPVHFDLFYNLSPYQTTIFNFTAMALIVGMTYMCVDLFIKQYTRRLDSDQNLSPLLKGITVTFMLQSALYSVTHVRHVGDGVRFLATSLSNQPVWSQCPKHLNGSECLNVEAVLQRCAKQGVMERVLINITSAHVNYIIHFTHFDRGLMTWRLFVTAVIWILNFCVATIPDSIEVILKLNKYVLFCKVGSSLVTLTFLAISTGRSKEAFMQLMDINVNSSTLNAIGDVALIYGIGMIGVYDFGIASPFTMVDNAVLIFTICLVVFAILRSMISKMLLLVVTDCVDVTGASLRNWHYLMFALLPLGTEFIYGQKLITVYIYLYLSLTLIPYLMLHTLTMSRLIHCEFPSIKVIYIVGFVCITGFCLSTPLLMTDGELHKVKIGIYYGVTCSLLFFGGLRVAIIMWIYGVAKFSTDIKFWLRFSPTEYWTVCWTILPVILWASFGARVFELSKLKDSIEFYVTFGWILISMVIMLGLQIRVIVRYAMKNNLIGAFLSNKKYGPHDPRDRKRRRKYNESEDHRLCYHECMTLDEEVECNHLPLMNTGDGPSSAAESESSLTKMYEDAPSGSPSVVTVVEINSNAKEKLP